MPQSTVHPEKRRLEFIDALRGIAALYVFVFHVVYLPQPKLETPGWLLRAITFGNTGVTLFFVVSAFTLCLSVDARKGEAHSVRRFLIRRIFRIVPLYLFWVVLQIAVLGARPGLKTLLFSLTFLFNFFLGKHHGIVPLSWTLSIEMLFYACFPLIHRWASTTPRALAFFAGSAALSVLIERALPAHLRGDHYFYFNFFHHLPAFALGMAGYYLWRSAQSDPNHPASRPSLTLGLGGVGFVWLLLVPSGHLMQQWSWLAAATYAVLLLGLSKVAVKALVNPLTCFFGKISYSVYLNHAVIVMLLIPAYRAIYGNPWPLEVRLLACIGLTLVPLVPLSMLTFQWVEEPGQALGRRLAAKA